MTGRREDKEKGRGWGKGTKASRTKTQVHIEGDVGRWPGVTSIKDGLPSTDGRDALYTSMPFLAGYASLDNHPVANGPDPA